jgi:hypothetical protein
MVLVSAIVMLSVVAIPLAVVAAWFVDRGHGGLGSLVGGTDSESWWRSTMPLPQGVQEEDGVTWRVRVDVRPADSRDAFEVQPMTTRARVGFRPPSTSD